MAYPPHFQPEMQRLAKELTTLDGQNLATFFEQRPAVWDWLRARFNTRSRRQEILKQFRSAVQNASLGKRQLRLLNSPPKRMKDCPVVVEIYRRDDTPVMHVGLRGNGDILVDLLNVRR